MYLVPGVKQLIKEHFIDSFIFALKSSFGGFSSEIIAKRANLSICDLIVAIQATLVNIQLVISNKLSLIPSIRLLILCTCIWTSIEFLLTLILTSLSLVNEQFLKLRTSFSCGKHSVIFVGFKNVTAVVPDISLQVTVWWSSYTCKLEDLRWSFLSYYILSIQRKFMMCQENLCCSLSPLSIHLCYSVFENSLYQFPVKYLIGARLMSRSTNLGKLRRTVMSPSLSIRP